MKRVVIFGSTGSIGRSALEVLRRDRKKFKVLGLSTYKNIRVLREQIKEFRPQYVCVVDEKRARALEGLKKIKLFKGEKGLEEFSTLYSDVALMGIVGISSLKPLLITMKYTSRIALASKEALVVGGSLVKRAAYQYAREIIPVDSEINALFQLLSFLDRKYLQKVYLTASGGSLSGWLKKDWKKIKAKDVLRHPTWKMGKRITVDSATLINKGFEVVETYYLFDLPYKDIKILLQKNSLIHALIEMRDGINFLCMYEPDMKVPLSYSLYYPQRCPFASRKLWERKREIPCEPLKPSRYPLLQIVLEATQLKNSALVVVNAADEVAVDYFLKGKISFLELINIVERVFASHKDRYCSTLEDILFWDNWAREKAREYVHRKKFLFSL